MGKVIGSSTTNILRHMKKHHKHEYDKGMGKSSDTDQPKIDTQFEKKNTTWKRESKKSVHWDRLVLRFFTNTGQSISVIENKEFRELLPKEYQAPNRQTFMTEMLHNGYMFTKNAVQEKISLTQTCS